MDRILINGRNEPACEWPIKDWSKFWTTDKIRIWEKLTKEPIPWGGIPNESKPA